MQYNDFEEMWNNAKLDNITNKAKTISKLESRSIFYYWKKYKPKIFLEFGTQLGCSMCIFIEIAKYLNINTQFHSWDIIDVIKYADKKEFNFHREDITGREIEIFNKYKPDFLFLDCHVYSLTKSLINICLQRKINFMMHDITDELYERCRKESNNFTNFNAYTTWEAFLARQLEICNNNYNINYVKDRYGICILEMKK